MSNVTNFDRPAVEILLNLIFSFNQYSVPANKITFGLPQPLDVYPGVISDENTFVSVTVDKEYDGRFGGENGFMYRRYSLTELVEDPAVNFDLPEFPFQIADILPSINARFHTQLTTNDVMDIFVESREQLVLIAHPHSLVWMGSTPFSLGGSIPVDVRLLETGAQRITEAGELRIMESA